VQWGNPNPGSGPVFLDINTQPNDESFNFTMVISGIPTEWWGGGQEANLCPGGGGTSLPNYEGDFPCFEPMLTPMPDVVHICPGDEVTLTVLPNHLVEDILWEPGGQTTPSITVTLLSDETFTITGSNVACDVTTTITVIVDPLPFLTPQEAMVEVCEGTPAVLAVNPEFADVITWAPGGGVGPVIVVVPTTSPAIYTASGRYHLPRRDDMRRRSCPIDSEPDWRPNCHLDTGRLDGQHYFRSSRHHHHVHCHHHQFLWCGHL
jgi:hypothetical protein